MFNVFIALTEFFVRHNWILPDIDAVGLLVSGKIESNNLSCLLICQSDFSEAVEDVGLRLDGVEEREDVDVIHVEVHSVDKQRGIGRLKITLFFKIAFFPGFFLRIRIKNVIITGFILCHTYLNINIK